MVGSVCREMLQQDQIIQNFERMKRWSAPKENILQGLLAQSDEKH